MKIVVLGASGLIGHRLYHDLSMRFGNVSAFLHGPLDRFATYDIFDPNDVVENIEALDFTTLQSQLEIQKPDVILNCIGITKRRNEIQNAIEAIGVNALFPHLLAGWAKENGARVIHFSTDCVFDGALGGYTEKSNTTATDEYGKTKALGEIDYAHTLTLRSSFIGRELSVHSELLDWFLHQRGQEIKGFTKAWYSGISTLHMARIVGDIIEHHKELSGLYQLSCSAPISKYDLLCLANEAFGMKAVIHPDDSFEIKPTLDSTKLQRAINFSVPSWPVMMAELADDPIKYKPLS